MKFNFSNFFLRVPLTEKILFAKHLSMMINAGMSEIESVRLIRKQIKNRSFAKILDKVISDLESGVFLSLSLKKFSSVFGEIFVNLIEIGEITGTLSQNLNYLALEMKKSQSLRKKIRSAMIYPIIILFVTIAVTSMLIFFVLPKILPMFSSLHIQLPLGTRILIAVSQFLLHYYFIVIIAAFVLFFIISALLRLPLIRYFYHRLILVLPIVGNLAIAYNLANISRTLGILLKSGIKIVEGMSICSKIASNDVYKKNLLLSSEEIKKGEALYKFFEKQPAVFSSTFTRMIEVGEQTGKLEENLAYLADFYENEVDETTKNLSSVLEPILLVILGGLVGFVVISIITPIYEMTQSVAN